MKTVGSHNPVNLGRETPYSLLSHQGDLLVLYRDGVTRYHVTDGRATIVSECFVNTEAGLLLNDASLVISEGAHLSRFSPDLDSSVALATRTEEDIIGLVALHSEAFLSTDDNGTTTYWETSEGELVPSRRWPVECIPLFAKDGGKVTVCTEQGRIQERDSKSGTVLKTWSGPATAAWGAVDEQGFHGLTISDGGEVWLWDLASREPLFALDIDYSAVRAVFKRDGTEGAVLGIDGEVSTFRMVDGGCSEPLLSPEAPLVSITFVESALYGVDENGGLWALSSSDDGPLSLGGTWAGWATCVSCQDSHGLFLGTATGSLENFKPDGRRGSASLQLHHDALIGIENRGDNLLTISADASVCKFNPVTRDWECILELPGNSVVSHAVCSESGTLWLGLEDGLIAWLQTDGTNGTISLQGRRVEEVHPAGPGACAVVTDRGSVRLLQVEK